MCSYNLKYNDYNANISEGFQSLLATSDISDITLAVEGKFFKAHQVILSLFSPYFRELFCMNPSKHTIFFMKNVKYKIMQDLLAFMYEGKVQIPEEDFNLFWETAKELKIKGLSEDGEPPCNNSKSEEPVQIVEENVSSIAQDRKNASDNNEESEEARHSLKRQADFSPTVPGGATIKQSKISLPLPQTDEIGLESSSIDLSQNLASGDLYDEHNHSGMANANIQVKQEFVDNWQTSDENISIQNKGEDMDNSDMDLCVGLKWEEEENRMNNLGHASNMDNGQVFPSGTQVVHTTEKLNSSPRQAASMASTSNELSSLLTGLPPTTQHNIEQKFSFIVGQLEDLQEQNKQILYYLNPHLGMSYAPFDPPVPLPMETFTDIITMEEYLKNVNNYNNIVSYLTGLGGADTRTSTIWILKRCLTNQNASEWNFLGKGHKKAFSSLLLCRAVVAAVRRRQHGSTETEINGFIKVWLKHAPQRLKGTEKKTIAGSLT